MNIEEFIAKSLGLKTAQVQKALALLNDGATIPFIARYRKEETGSLDEDALRQIEQAWAYQNNLKERKDSILAILEEKKLLKPELKKQIEEAATLAALEDVYRPYKEKRKTKASEAIAAGYGPLAESILKQKQPASVLAKNDEEALKQAGYILAEQFADDPKLRAMLKQEIVQYGSLTSSKKKDAEDERGVYENYYEFSNPLKKVPAHRIMALDRGEKEKVLTVSVETDNDRLESMLSRKIIRSGVSRDYLQAVIHDALIRLLLPSIKREIRSELREQAHAHAIDGFSDNLEHLLMTRPLKGKTVFSWDPGYRNGCKLAMLSATGEVLDTDVVFPFLHGKAEKDKDWYKKSVQKTRQWLTRWKPELIVIGNGTASRESVSFICELLPEYPGTSYVIGSEAGASVYSASPLAKEEFPDLPVEKRSAISIGRRVQDPLSELVKVDPQALGIGEYQHDVSQKLLKEALDFVTDKAVNRVGVNVNTASLSILQHISGLTKQQAKKILTARNAQAFDNRQQLKKLLSAKAYEQSIGFLRIPGGSNPLDATGIHPESYPATEALLDKMKLDIRDLHSCEFHKTLMNIKTDQMAADLQIDKYTLKDIVSELLHPGLDPRDSLDGPILKQGVLTLEDLTPGMHLEGTVRNVTSFGAFVDIGLHEDGLVHISKMSRRFISDPREAVHTGQIVSVTVLQTDPRRRRISLSMVD